MHNPENKTLRRWPKLQDLQNKRVSFQDLQNKGFKWCLCAEGTQSWGSWILSLLCLFYYACQATGDWRASELAWLKLTELSPAARLAGTSHTPELLPLGTMAKK